MHSFAVWAGDLIELCPLLGGSSMSIYLESNGTLPEALERVVREVRHVAMDIKLESATGEPTPWEAHRRFLHLAATRGVQVKVVVTAETTSEQQSRLADLVESVRPTAPVVLQPVTPVRGIRRPSPMHVLRLQQELKRRLSDIRVIPQVHRLMDQK